MIIKNMFSKPIDRDIKGVIKVGQDDNANIKQELEEYVVTRELQKHFADFFSSYKKGINGNTDKMGVWISGFFGSGKSHFLKILSYILANKDVTWNREHATPVDRPFDFLILPKESSELFSTANAFSNFVKCIIGSEDATKMWQSFIQQLQDQGLDDYIKRQQAAEVKKEL